MVPDDDAEAAARDAEHALVENTRKFGTDDEEAASALLDQTPGPPADE